MTHTRKLLFACAIAFVSACSSVRGFAAAIPQTFEFGNDGSKAISDLRLSYANLVLPSGMTTTTYVPDHMMATSETWDATIPKTAKATWYIGGNLLQAEIPIRSLVDDPSRFYGWRLYVVDDRLDLYLIYKTASPDNHYRVARKKVYSAVGVKTGSS